MTPSHPDDQPLSPPAGWIPPQYRRRILRPMTATEQLAIQGTIGTIDPATGQMRPYTLEEISERGLNVIVGVVDSRLDPPGHCHDL